MRYLSVFTPDPKSAGSPPSQEQMAEMGKLMEESRKQGTLVATGMFLLDGQPGIRVRRSGVQMTTVDQPGPFSDAGAHRCGFAVLEAKCREEAIELAKGFLKVAGDGECELSAVQYVDLATESPAASCGQAQSATTS